MTAHTLIIWYLLYQLSSLQLLCQEATSQLQDGQHKQPKWEVGAPNATSSQSHHRIMIIVTRISESYLRVLSRYYQYHMGNIKLTLFTIRTMMITGIISIIIMTIMIIMTRRSVNRYINHTVIDAHVSRNCNYRWQHEQLHEHLWFQTYSHFEIDKSSSV